MSYGYWKREVNNLLEDNRLLRSEIAEKNQAITEKDGFIDERVVEISDLKAKVGRLEATVAELTASADKETAKSENLQKRVESTAQEYRMLEEEKAEANARYEACKKQSAEDLEERDAKIEKLTLKLDAEKAKNKNKESEGENKKPEDVNSKQSGALKEGGGDDDIAGFTEETEKETGDVADPFHLAAPDEPDQQGRTHLRGGVEMTEEFETETLPNPRQRNPDTIQVDTLTDALILESTDTA